MIGALPGLFSYLFCDCGTPWSFLLPFFFHTRPTRTKYFHFFHLSVFPTYAPFICISLSLGVNSSFRHINTILNLLIGVNFVNMFGMPQNTCIQCLLCIHFILFVYVFLLDVCRYTFSITDLCLQVVV